MSSLVLTGDTSGSGTITVPAVAGTFTATIGAATGTHFPFTSGTAVASTSGTSIDFTSIPSWVKRITVMFNGVSTNGTSVLRVRLGSGSISTTGYLSIGSQIGGGTAGSTTYTDGLSVGNVQTAAATLQGSCSISTLGSNAWVAQGAFYGTDTTTKFLTGSITLGGTLDMVRITTVNGTDTFDAGSINILYE